MGKENMAIFKLCTLLNRHIQSCVLRMSVYLNRIKETVKYDGKNAQVLLYIV